MTLYHQFDALTNTRGDSLPGYRVIARLPNGGAIQPLYGDISGTPIVSTSGLADTAVTDAAGNYSFFITANATYDLEYYTPAGVFLSATRNVPMIAGIKGDTGDPGPSNNTRNTLAALKAASITDMTSLYDGSLWTWETANAPYTADDINVVKANGAALSVGAWVRQSNRRADLAASGGATLVGYSSGTVKSELDAIAAGRVAVIRFDEYKQRNPLLTDVGILSALISQFNSSGAINPEACLGFVVELPSRLVLWDTPGTLPALLVSNVTFRGASEGGTNVLVHDRSLFKLGASGIAPIENVFLRDITFISAYGNNPTPTQIIVEPVNCARVYLDNLAFKRVRYIIKATIPNGCVVSTIYVRNCRGVLMPDSNPIHVVNTAGGRFIDWRVLWSDFVPLANPTNPTIVPVAITGITKANPAVVSSAAHGFTSGMKIRLRDVEGMTEVNGNDYVVTVSDADHFSLNGVNSTGFGTYTAGGFAVERHFSYQYDSSVVYVEGQYDTGYIVGGVHLHWNRLVSLKVSGVMAYLFLWHIDDDYLGQSLLKVEMAGGVLAVVQVQGGWVSAYDGPILDLVRSGSGSILGLDMSGLRIGFAGGGIVTDPSAILSRPTFTNIRVDGLHRIESGAKYMFNISGASDGIVLNDIRMDDPAAYFGSTAGTTMVPTVGFSNSVGATDVTIQNCYFRASTVHYGVTLGTGKRVLSGNQCASGVLPEYLVTSTPTVGASPFTWTNNTGSPVQAILSGGAISEAAIGLSGGSYVALASGSNVVVQVGRGQPLRLTYSSAPTLTVVPVNS